MNEALPAGDALADFVVVEPLADLRNVWMNHVVPGRIQSSDLVDGARVTTVAGTKIDGHLHKRGCQGQQCQYYFESSQSRCKQWHRPNH
jgi:hypothetical protein